jgi:aminobenzoyl-glutamate transport protein
MNSPPDPSPGPGRLDRIERLGNALPDPVFMFLWLILILVAASVLASAAGVGAVHPSSGELLRVESLLSADNVRRLLVEMPKTFTSFPPLGLVLVVMLGAAVAERSGFFSASIGRLVKRAPGPLLIPATFAVALMSHHAADAAYVVLIPLAAIVFQRSGRHPLLGVAVAYAGISGAFAANIIPGQFDALILGITHSAALMIDPDHQLNPLGNWWFTAGLGLLLFTVAWPVAARIVEPYTSRWRVDGTATESLGVEAVDDARASRGLKRAALAGAVVVAVFVGLTTHPDFSPLVDDEATGAARLLPLHQSLIAGSMIFFIAVGWAYGSAAGTVGSHRDIVKMMGLGLRDLTPYLVLAFFAAHFVALFSWSNLGPILAIKGAAALQGLDLSASVMLLPLLLVAMVFDLLIGSSSAKWSAMAPIVVPMLMLLGISPEMTTAAYRMGDSVVNIITPIASNFVLVLVICQRWVKDFGIGSLIALMLPFSIAFGIAGFTLVALWAGLGLPPGPGVDAHFIVGAP